MKLTNRELVIGWGTLVLLLIGATYVWMISPRLTEWRQSAQDRDLLARRRDSAERVLGSREEVNQQLDKFRTQLKQYPMGQDVTAELLRTLERTARENNVNLVRREPGKERNVGDIYEVSINCSLEADLPALVHFLYALQSQGAMLDIQQLTVTPGTGGPQRLKGNFTLDCAYTRTGPAASAP